MALQGNHFLKEAQIERLRPRVTFGLVNLWQITRTDNVTIRMATTDKGVHFEGHWFEPAGPSPSDMEQGEAAAEADFELNGVLDHKHITAEDLLAGRFDNARMTHWVVDLERPWVWFRKHVWWIRNVSIMNDMFKVEIAGAERFLTVPLGRRYDKDCDKVLGSLECGAEVVSFTSTIAGVPSTQSTGEINGTTRDDAALSISNPGGGFPKVTLTPPLEDQSPSWAFGKVRFLSGSNQGDIIEIGYETGGDSETGDMKLTLAFPSAYEMRVGDQIEVFAGCDGTIGTCERIYDNKINFGGQTQMPDTSQLYEAPQQADATEYDQV